MNEWRSLSRRDRFGSPLSLMARVIFVRVLGAELMLNGDKKGESARQCERRQVGAVQHSRALMSVNNPSHCRQPTSVPTHSRKGIEKDSATTD